MAPPKEFNKVAQRNNFLSKNLFSKWKWEMLGINGKLNQLPSWNLFVEKMLEKRRPKKRGNFFKGKGQFWKRIPKWFFPNP